MTAEKYPKCISCGSEMSSQDSRGWEKIAFPVEGGINLRSMEIWLCPSCIHKTTACKDAVESAKKHYEPHAKRMDELQRGLASFLNLLESCRDKDGM